MKSKMKKRASFRTRKTKTAGELRGTPFRQARYGGKVLCGLPLRGVDVAMVVAPRSGA